MRLYNGLPIGEVCERGRRLIDEKLSAEDTERFRGQMVVVDVITGEMEIGESSMLAGKKLRERISNPTAYIGRVGHPTAFRMGFAPRTERR